MKFPSDRTESQAATPEGEELSRRPLTEMNPTITDALSQQKRSGRLAAVWHTALRPHGLVAAAYLAATAFTGAGFMGDTADYVESLLTRVEFWEFGHLVWRPMGWLVLQVSRPLTPSMAAGDPRAEAAFALIAINWIAGLVAVLLMRAWLSRISKREWVATVATLAFVFSHAFLNFSQTGSSYIPGLMLLLLGLYLLARAGERPERSTPAALLAGAALAGSVAMWFPYVFVVPAALVSPLFMFGFDKLRMRLAVRSALTFALTASLAYGAVLANLGIYKPAGVRTWVAASSHGVTTGGPSRVVLGLSRSFIDMGNDGVALKRFALHDPINPVSLFDLLRLSLWKLGLFYLFLCAIVINLFRSTQGRRTLGLLAAGTVPLLIFAVEFDGGAVERYLPLYPLIFLAFSCSLFSDRSRPSLKYAALAFVIAATVTNVSALANPVLDRRQEAAVGRVKDLLPLLARDSRLVVINQQDELLNFRRAFPFNPLNTRLDLRVYPVVSVNTAQVDTWREKFATLAVSDWERGSDVWISRRVLSARPLAAWSWVEGDDRRIGWNDIHTFFADFEVQNTAEDDDGFVMLVKSPKNERLLAMVANGV